MANTTTGPKSFPPPKRPSAAAAQDSVTVHVLGFDQITRENFRVKLQAQAALTGGRDPEGLSLGFFLNGILIGKAAFDDFGVADAALTIEWAALEKGKTLTVKVKGMEQAVPVQWDSPKSPQQEEAKKYQPVISEITQNMVNISAGTFWMGGTDADQQFKQANEFPRHQVKLAAFAISKYLVTQAQWQAVMGNNPSNYIGEHLPVDSVSWNDAQEFLLRLNILCGISRSPLQFRLPTEAEWEYACRAGTQTIWPFGNTTALLSQYAWFAQNSEGETHPVGQLKPNAWGLFDMLGNVTEWCQDWFDECYYVNSPQKNPQGGLNRQGRAIRGGGYFDPQNNCRSARRDWYIPDCRVSNVGFRMAYSL